MIVLDSNRAVMNEARHVKVDDAAVRRWAERIHPRDMRPSGHDMLAKVPGNAAQVANLVFFIDALNFCFWSKDPIRFNWNGKTYTRFNAMLASIIRTAGEDRCWCDPEFWQTVPDATIREVLGCEGELLLMEERIGIIRDVARTLIERYDGQFIEAVESVNRRAWPLAVLLMTNFDSFRDVARYHDKPVYFLKRAQICALDLSMAWEARGHGPLDNLDELTAFADYRVPQALRHIEILKLTPELAARIDGGEELPEGSEEEVEVRAGSIIAVEEMRKALDIAGKPAPAWKIDWHLWDISHDPAIKADHHRTRTIFY